jgi:hypothetical protein
LEEDDARMAPLIGRTFLLLLLACDFVGDPGYLVSPLARPHCSTPTDGRTPLLRSDFEWTLLASAQSPTDDCRLADNLATPVRTTVPDDLPGRNRSSGGLSFLNSFLESSPFPCLLQRLHC